MSSIIDRICEINGEYIIFCPTYSEVEDLKQFFLSNNLIVDIVEERKVYCNMLKSYMKFTFKIKFNNIENKAKFKWEYGKKIRSENLNYEIK